MLESSQESLQSTFGTDVATIGVDPDELARLCAIDSLLYGKTFFPKTFRQKSPIIHRDIFDMLEDQAHRLVALSVFRGAAKTTILRTFVSKRVAYGTSRTILFVSASMDASKRSLRWLKRQVEYNTRWAQFYGLTPGDKWSEEHIEIKHAVLGITVNIIAVGITGQTRGINIDDYRPDLIVVDDPCDEETTNTPEQRKKTERLFFGALYNSLAPTSENPASKMALLQTPLDAADLISLCAKDPEWASRVYSCFDADGNSTWADRFSTETLRAQKEAFIARNQASIWLREMECTVVGEADAAFRPEWVQYYHELPEQIVTFYGIDPVPPPTEGMLLKGLAKHDHEVHAVIGVHKSSYYLVDLQRMRGHEPDWSVSTFFSLIDKWKPIKVRVEGTAYQRTLGWLLRKAMKLRRRYVQIDDAPTTKSKVVRIKQSLTGPLANKQFFCHPRFTDFLSQLAAYPNVTHDDDLDAVAMAMEAAQDFDVLQEDDVIIEGHGVEKFDQVTFRGAP